VNLPLDLGEQQLVAFVLVLARVGGIFVLAPAFSSRAVPMRAKMIVAAAISLALTPVATRNGAISTDPIVFSSLIVKEVAVGLAIALSIGIVAAAISAGASLLDTLIGFSFSSLVDPMSNNQGGPLGQLYGLFASMIFLLSGGDQLVVMGLARSYSLLPLQTVPDAGALADLAVTGLTQVFVVGVEIAAPVVLTLVLTDAAFGLLARAVPQMNVFFVGIPAKILIGLTVIAASLPFVARHVVGDVETAILHSLQALRPAG
jgi:flagellar biosynthesis protein FliR